MIKNAILICDELDASHGEYFQKCATHASSLLNQKSEIKQKHLSSTSCNAVLLDHVEFPKHTEKSLFCLFSHGDDNRFVSKGQPFIDGTINCDICLDNGLVYSVACSTGKTFGPNIVKKNASFFGYDKRISILPNHHHISIECDNYGLYKMIDGNTLTEAKKAAQERYNYYIDHGKLNSFDSSKLRVARDSIVVFGNLEGTFF